MIPVAFPQVFFRSRTKDSTDLLDWSAYGLVPLTNWVAHRLQIAMPRSGAPSAVGDADQENVLEGREDTTRDEILRLRHYVAQLEGQVRALEAQSEAASRRRQEWTPEDSDLRADFRFVRPLQQPASRFQLHQAEEQFRCNVCSNTMGHSACRDARGRPSRAPTTNWQRLRPEDLDVGGGFRVCERNCGREFRMHPKHQEETFCCSACRRGRRGHTENCDARSRPSTAEVVNAFM